MFQDAVYEAQQRGADYVVYCQAGVYKFVELESLQVVASCDYVGQQLVAAGLAAGKASLFDYDADEFVCGTVAQLVQEDA
jgi:hypothetical protein